MDTKMTDSENWTLENGRLTIRGNAMEYDGEAAPWQACRDGIREAVLAEGISSVPRDAFRDCRNLRSVRFPESVREIGAGSFRGCASLSEIVIPAGVRRIGEEAFLGCRELSSVTFSGPAPEMDPSVFAGVTARIYYPAGAPARTEGPAGDTEGQITGDRTSPAAASRDEVGQAAGPVSNTREASPQKTDGLPPGEIPAVNASGPSGDGESGAERRPDPGGPGELREITRFLQRCGIPDKAIAARVRDAWGRDGIRILEEDPYRLADIRGIGFRTADALASRMGFSREHPLRLRGGLLFALRHMCETGGHCFARRDQLLREAQKYLRADPRKLEETLEEAAGASCIIRDGDAFYLPEYYSAEVGCAKKLLRLKYTGRGIRIDADFALRNAGLPPDCDEEQRAAVRNLAVNKVSVLTGGPGTGRAAVIRGILSVCHKRKCRILLAAPTGREAERLSGAAGREAVTVHRLLEYRPGKGFRRDGGSPLEGDVLLVDGCSMMDIFLLDSLLRALPDTMALILAGDADQLPGAGPGNVLADIISSGVFPVSRLTGTGRQDEGISMNAQKILRGEMPDLSNPNGTNFFFEAAPDDAAITETVVELCARRLPGYYHTDPRDIQVLTPVRKKDRPCSAGALNPVLQDALNPSDVYLQVSGTQFRLHDKVMQTRNNYDKEVFNGDIGRVAELDPAARRMTVDFGGRLVPYEGAELPELDLAYAVTVHRSRGAEYPIVVMPLTLGHRSMLTRGLLYTAVTRARDAVVLVGDREAVRLAVRSGEGGGRNTGLAERLRDPQMAEEMRDPGTKPWPGEIYTEEIYAGEADAVSGSPQPLPKIRTKIDRKTHMVVTNLTRSQLAPRFPIPADRAGPAADKGRERFRELAEARIRRDAARKQENARAAPGEEKPGGGTDTAGEVTVGSRLLHGTYGEGTVTAISPGKITVSFHREERYFTWPDAFEMGYLKLRK